MSTEKIEDNLFELKLELGLIEQQQLSSEECAQYRNMLLNGEKLPDDIRKQTGVAAEYAYFYRIIEHNYPEEKLNEYIKINNAAKINTISKNIKTIKSCVVFFTVLAVIGLIGGFIIALQ